MNKTHPFSATPVSGARFRNHAAPLGRLLAAIASLLTVSFSLCHAASCTLAWDASSDPNIAGYKLQYETASGNPSPPIDAGKTTTFTVSNLNDSTTYFFTVTAQNAAGVESQPSNRVSYTTPALSPTPPPSGAFVIGDRVVALQGVAARNVASTAGNILQLHATGELGTVIGGPASANGWTWWNINYDTGSDGWSTQEGYLALNTYTLTVVDGSGDGSYPAGRQAPVSADTPPAGQEFALWTNDDGALANGILNNPLSSTTIATMPSRNVTIKATYKAVTTPSGAFVIGDRVVALQGVAARNVASTAGNILQLHATGESGTVIGGPVSANGWTWWNINYDTGSDGWSTQEGYLAKATGTP
ncbi:MAG: fibronectin type III domain-containing protein [Terrimicrobiaceae bacterium]